MVFNHAPDVKKEIDQLVKNLEFGHITALQIFCFRSYGSSSRAIARIWSFPRIWQLALNLPPNYIIEVIAERFDRLSPQDKTKVLIHELLHIPQSFSGALVPHHNRGETINQRRVDRIFWQLQNKKKT